MTDDKLQAGGLIQNDHLAMIGIMDIPSYTLAWAAYSSPS